MSDATYPSWGRLKPVHRAAVCVEDLGALAGRRGDGSLLPYGNGRSYGDSCHNDAGTLIDSRGQARIHDFDPVGGTLTADAGILLSQITHHVAAAGWFLPVTPGTQFITLGGAIANDIHGKNHHRRGTFGNWVESFELERSDRGLLSCSRDIEPELFAATIAGMGLTGLIRQATIRLLKVPSLSIDETTTRFGSLDEYFDLAEAADLRHEYAVAWIDSLVTGASLGRGHLITGDHAAEGDRSGVAARPLITIPFTPPVSPLRGLGLSAFNGGYFRRSPDGSRQRVVRFDSFFYPLDRIGRWNRLYGPHGLHQHQSVVPLAAGPDAVRALITCAQRAGQGSFLTVLKRFGAVASPGLTSFPREGYTLTLDFPDRGERTLKLLAELDSIAIGAGGAVNPYKDARMSPATFAAGFPRWAELEALRDPVFCSDFWRRTALRLAPASAAGDKVLAETKIQNLPFRAVAVVGGASTPTY
ncbi:MAG: FAD-binding oxidoreductase [Aurantimonas endophytica]|uniref:FAD/FMN-containing dehydrogenase n=1 Tax=Aurantimonas endophytica TaxID=1522175 RepID=A0A7W6H9T5_9HYPH|nr:FAD-binding oxidoreductase [Aurantimonas endophytica]MBB4001132.1 FAD/FMN-containing dehydrogenase [Aurantimonas endophytica]MCO6403213.1 FAD-binding protein [Aurantimonas endophytica]